jgi:hypothetical protein
MIRRYLISNHRNKKMNKKLSIVAGILAATVLFSFGRARASFPLPLSALAGNWAGQGSDTFSLCFNSGFSSLVDCSSAENTAFFSQVTVTQQTADSRGNSCATITATNSVEFPFPPTPANTFTQISVGKTTSYSQTTETGTVSFTNYNAGPGTFCNGAVLVNTGNAAPVLTGTTAFAISQFGNRADGIVQTAEAEPISYVDNYVGSGYLNRQ